MKWVFIFPSIKHLGISGITLFPFIFLRNKMLKQDKRIMNHEMIHIRQQMELLVLPFYILYFIEFVLGLIKYQNWFSAYINISFEKEAFKNDSNLDYLKKRKLWAWKKYY